MSSEVKRYDAVHLRYEDSNIRYGEGCEVEVVTASDYAALEAENARLVERTGYLVEFVQQMARQQGEPYYQKLAKAALAASSYQKVES